MASRGKGARFKGAQFERDLAKIFTDAVGIEFKRGLGQTRAGGKEIPDIYCDDLPWLHVEAKRQKNCNIKAALLQAQDDCSKSKMLPVVVTKDDRSSILVTTTLEDFLCFLGLVIDDHGKKDPRKTKRINIAKQDQ